MPSFQDIDLIPGVNTQFTLEKNKAGISVSQLIRHKTGLPEKIGGWTNFYPTPLSSTTIRDVHAWQGLLGGQFVGSGSLTNLTVVSSGVLKDITPQTNDTTPTPSFSVAASSNSITVVDAGSSATIYGAVRFDTPISLGSVILSSAYPVATAIDANTYAIQSQVNSTAAFSSAGTLPTFQTTAGSAIVDVVFPSAQYLPIQGIFYPFRAPTTVGGVTIKGAYPVTSVIDSTHFQINIGVQAVTSSGPVSMNGGKVALHYYNTQGPPPTSGVFGAGLFGANLFGVGTAPTQGLGTPITATDWSLDNWGEVLIAIPKNGPVYVWPPDLAFVNAQVVPQAPLFNTGGFVSQPQQILMLFGSVENSGVQDPLIVRWSDLNNYSQWTVSPQTAAGSFHFPTGSTLVGALQAPLYMVFWTDIDVWTATWAGQPIIWAFLRVGNGCGLIGQHAADVAQGSVFWCSLNNFFTLGPGGAQVLPCTVWDFFFKNFDRTNKSKVRAASNSVFNEISWFFPLSSAACAALGLTYTGENNGYVKLHIGEGNEYEWDFGVLSRTAWVDTTVVGPPIGTDGMGNLLQHDGGAFDASGTAINAYLETGYFQMGDGTDIALVDWILPDIIWQSGEGGSSPGTLLFTFYTTDYPSPSIPGASGARTGERVYGPFTVTQATQFINTRMRGRFWRCRAESNDVGTFWRLGRIKFRWGPSGRR